VTDLASSKNPARRDTLAEASVARARLRAAPNRGAGPLMLVAPHEPAEFDADPSAPSHARDPSALVSAQRGRATTTHPHELRAEERWQKRSWSAAADFTLPRLRRFRAKEPCDRTALFLAWLEEERFR
jgi:hypothetical protein